MIKKAIARGLILAALVIPGILSLQAQSVCADRWTNTTDSIVVAKNFPLLELFSAPPYRELFRTDPVLRQVAGRRKKAVQGAVENPSAGVQDYVAAVQWTPREINEVVQVCQRLCVEDKGAGLLRGIRSRYPSYKPLTDTALVRRALGDAAEGMNHILKVYLLGKKPSYAAIDAMDSSNKGTVFRSRLREELSAVLSDKSSNLFFDLPLKTALLALRLNGRDEAARYEPLAEGWNRSPVAASRVTDFTRYRYSMILVPGLGPEERGVALDPGGAKRCEEAARRYRSGEAPFLVVSGGHVHPNKTLYCEAVEMKRYLVEKLRVPDSVIFIEPHARHTTTNLRNAGRMVYAFHLPEEMPVLIVTDKGQANYIMNGMKKVAMRDLGYLPYSKLSLLAEGEISFVTVPRVLQPNPLDPLDP